MKEAQIFSIRKFGLNYIEEAYLALSGKGKTLEEKLFNYNKEKFIDSVCDTFKDEFYTGDDEHKVRFYSDFDGYLLNLPDEIDGKIIKDFRLGTVFNHEDKLVDYFIDAITTGGDVFYDYQDELSDDAKKLFNAAENGIAEKIIGREIAVGSKDFFNLLDSWGINIPDEDRENFSEALDYYFEGQGYTLKIRNYNEYILCCAQQPDEPFNLERLKGFIENRIVEIKERNDEEEKWHIGIFEKVLAGINKGTDSVCYSVTFPCGFTFPKEITDNDPGLNKQEEYRWKIFDELKEKYGFGENDAETELFTDKNNPSDNSFNINFAAPVPVEYRYPKEKTDEWIETVEKDLYENFGCSFINWQGGERVMDIAESNAQVHEYDIPNDFNMKKDGPIETLAKILWDRGLPRIEDKLLDEFEGFNYLGSEANLSREITNDNKIRFFVEYETEYDKKRDNISLLKIITVVADNIDKEISELHEGVDDKEIKELKYKLSELEKLEVRIADSEKLLNKEYHETTVSELKKVFENNGYTISEKLVEAIIHDQKHNWAQRFVTLESGSIYIEDFEAEGHDQFRFNGDDGKLDLDTVLTDSIDGFEKALQNFDRDDVYSLELLNELYDVYKSKLPAFEKLNVYEYFNKNLPEGIEPLDSEKLKILEDYIELEGDDLYINKKEDKIYRVWNSHTDDFDPSKPDVNLLHESGPADICFYVSKTAEDLWHQNLEDRENELAEENKKIMDYFNNLEKDIRAYEFAELNQCGVSELDSADEFRLFQIVLEKYNEKALGLKGGNDDYFNLMVRIGPENRVSDIWIALYDGNNDVKDFRYSDNLTDFVQDVLKRALPLVDSYMNASLEHDIVCDYVFPESFNYSDANGNQKVITIYEEPRWVFRNENKLFEILNADAGDIFDEINELKAKYPDKHFNFDIGKSLRYDDFDLWQGKDLSEESLSDKLDNFYMLRYWDDEGNITNFDYPYEFYMSDKELSDKLNLMIKNHVAENINNFQTYKSFRDVRVKQLLKEQFTKLMDPLHENANRNGYYLEAASVISKELMYHLGIPEDMITDSDGIRKAVCYSIWKSFGCPVHNDNKINFLDENNTVHLDKVLVTEDEYKVIDTIKFSELGEAPFKKHLEKVISDTMDEITSKIVQQPLCNNTNLEKLIREEIENNYNLKQNEKGEFVNNDNSSSYRLQTYSLSTDLEKALGLYGNKITYKGKEYPAIYSLHRTYAIGKDGKIDFSRFNGDSVSLYEGADVPDGNGKFHEVMFSDWPLDDIACRIDEDLKNDISTAVRTIFDNIASEQSDTMLPEKNSVSNEGNNKVISVMDKAPDIFPENIIEAEVKLSSVELAGEKFKGELKMKLPYFKNDPWLTAKIIMNDLGKNEKALLQKWFTANSIKSKNDFQKFFDNITGKSAIKKMTKNKNKEIERAR